MARHVELALLCAGMAAAAVFSTISGEILHHDAGYHHSRVVAAVIPLGTAAWGAACGGFTGRRAPLVAHLVCAVFIFVAFWLGATAQALLPSQEFLAAKSAKLLPTMFLGSVLLRKSYRWLDWGAAALAIVGLILVQPAKHDHNHGAGAGMTLNGAVVVLTSLVFDAAYANVQEQVVRAHGAQPNELAACGMGFAAILFFAVTVTDADSRAGLWRAATEMKVAGGLALFAAANVLGAVCGLRMVASFGASAAGFSSIIAKTTALAALLILFPRDVPLRTLVGAGLVFFAVVLASSGKPGPPPNVASDQPDEASECCTPMSSPVASPLATPLASPVPGPLAEVAPTADARALASSPSSGASARPHDHHDVRGGYEYGARDGAFALDGGVAHGAAAVAKAEMAATGNAMEAASASRTIIAAAPAVSNAGSSDAVAFVANAGDVAKLPASAPAPAPAAPRQAPPSPSRKKGSSSLGMLHLPLPPALQARLSRRPSMDDVLQHIGLPRPKRPTLDMLSPLAAAAGAGAMAPAGGPGSGTGTGGRFRFAGGAAGGGGLGGNSSRRHMSMGNLSSLAHAGSSGGGHHGIVGGTGTAAAPVGSNGAASSSQRANSCQPGQLGSRSPGRAAASPSQTTGIHASAPPPPPDAAVADADAAVGASSRLTSEGDATSTSTLNGSRHGVGHPTSPALRLRHAASSSALL